MAWKSVLMVRIHRAPPLQNRTANAGRRRPCAGRGGQRLKQIGFRPDDADLPVRHLDVLGESPYDQGLRGRFVPRQSDVSRSARAFSMPSFIAIASAVLNPMPRILRAAGPTIRARRGRLSPAGAPEFCSVAARRRTADASASVGAVGRRNDRHLALDVLAHQPPEPGASRRRSRMIISAWSSIARAHCSSVLRAE